MPLVMLENKLWLLRENTGLPQYDFDFERFFACRHPYQNPRDIEAIARIGAIADYPALYQGWAQEGVRLIHTPLEHLRCSSLPHWYALLEDLTPRSVWFEGVPSVLEIERQMPYPLFIKGERQTSRHRRSRAVARNRAELSDLLAHYRADPILHWQNLVCRELLELRLLEQPEEDRLPTVFEFRSFWWRGDLVGLGRYWTIGPDYALSAQEQQAALTLSRRVVERLERAWKAIQVQAGSLAASRRQNATR